MKTSNTVLDTYNALCNNSNRCIEAGIEFNIGNQVEFYTLTPQQGFELYELISYTELNDVDAAVNSYGEKIGVKNLASKI